jgi:hypothetical protein
MEIMDEKVVLYRPRAGISNPEGSIFRPFPYVKTSGDFSFRFPV